MTLQNCIGEVVSDTTELYRERLVTLQNCIGEVVSDTTELYRRGC